MKKMVGVGLTAFTVIMIAVCAWFAGFHNRKSQDDLPSLEVAAKMDEAEVHDLLTGYRNDQC